jgi:ComF family protein
MIIRIRKTKPQSGLDAAARQYNLEGAFALNDKCEINGKTIIIVDDIFTTGATINACAKLLMEKGAGKVKSLSLSIAAKKN